MATPKDKPTPRPARRRARKPDGRFQGDNPATPDLNEAWEPTEVTDALPKKDYKAKPKIDGPSNSTAGKYGRKGKIKPTFGKVTTTYN